jgi:hypothetical protein
VFTGQDQLVMQGEPGDFEPGLIVAMMGLRAPVTQPTGGTNRSRDKRIEIDLAITSYVHGGPEAQPPGVQAVWDAADAIEAYFRVSPNERLGGACYNAFSDVGSMTPLTGWDTLEGFDDPVPSVASPRSTSRSSPGSASKPPPFCRRSAFLLSEGTALVSTVQLRYVGALLHADVPILNRQGEPLDEHGEGCVVRGEVFTCDATVAGRPPKLDADGALELGDDGQPVDPGEGLLAQVGVFELAEAEEVARPAKTPARRSRTRPHRCRRHRRLTTLTTAEA